MYFEYYLLYNISSTKYMFRRRSSDDHNGIDSLFLKIYIRERKNYEEQPSDSPKFYTHLYSKQSRGGLVNKFTKILQDVILRTVNKLLNLQQVQSTFEKELRDEQKSSAPVLDTFIKIKYQICGKKCKVVLSSLFLPSIEGRIKDFFQVHLESKVKCMKTNFNSNCPQMNSLEAMKQGASKIFKMFDVYSDILISLYQAYEQLRKSFDPKIYSGPVELEEIRSKNYPQEYNIKDEYKLIHKLFAEFHCLFSEFQKFMQKVHPKIENNTQTVHFRELLRQNIVGQYKVLKEVGFNPIKFKIFLLAKKYLLLYNYQQGKRMLKDHQTLQKSRLKIILDEWEESSKIKITQQQYIYNHLPQILKKLKQLYESIYFQDKDIGDVLQLLKDFKSSSQPFFYLNLKNILDGFKSYTWIGGIELMIQQIVKSTLDFELRQNLYGYQPLSIVHERIYEIFRSTSQLMILIDQNPLFNADSLLNFYHKYLVDSTLHNIKNVENVENFTGLYYEKDQRIVILLINLYIKFKKLTLENLIQSSDGHIIISKIIENLEEYYQYCQKQKSNPKKVTDGGYEKSQGIFDQSMLDKIAQEFHDTSQPEQVLKGIDELFTLMTSNCKRLIYLNEGEDVVKVIKVILDLQYPDNLSLAFQQPTHSQTE